MLTVSENCFRRYSGNGRWLKKFQSKKEMENWEWTMTNFIIKGLVRHNGMPCLPCWPSWYITTHIPSPFPQKCISFFWLPLWWYMRVTKAPDRQKSDRSDVFWSFNGLRADRFATCQWRASRTPELTVQLNSTYFLTPPRKIWGRSEACSIFCEFLNFLK